MTAHAQRLHADSIVAIVHDHMPPAHDLEAVIAGGVSLKVALPVVDVRIERDFPRWGPVFDGWTKYALECYDDLLRQIEATEGRIVVATTVEGIRRAKHEGRIAFILGAEGGKLLEGSLGVLRMLHRLGVRFIELNWAYDNQLCGTQGLPPGTGLTTFGRDCVREMNRLGMIIDVEHSSYRGFYDVLELSEKPILFSHGGATAVASERNRGWWGCFLPDDAIKQLAGAGGLIGINFFPYIVKDAGATREDLYAHFDHICSLVGPEYVCLGCDYFPDWGDWADIQKAQNQWPFEFAIGEADLGSFTEGLLERGYSDEAVRMILGGNFVRLCEAVFGE
jgi:membrane dipeptidase